MKQVRGEENMDMYIAATKRDLEPIMVGERLILCCTRMGFAKGKIGGRSSRIWNRAAG